MAAVKGIGIVSLFRIKVTCGEWSVLHVYWLAFVQRFNCVFIVHSNVIVIDRLSLGYDTMFEAINIMI